ncbi:MAG TPA: hypothetical protein ENO36_03170 [Fervidicoccus fontis]|uniref:Metallo-beta-lactamase domain-containing protein n=1 Tax=Fervidicoccus fontis TaxID=683846 RepID=A0A7C2YZI1_9CREN|nr:hypothetical protein [Fervidicoccus fontis]
MGDGLLVQAETFSRATVNSNGAILLGRRFEIDSFAGRPIRVISHFHSDHTLQLSKSKRTANHIVATYPTLEALRVLGQSLPEEKLLPIEYGRSIAFEEEVLTLIKSTHVIGSAQVLVELPDGIRVGYTGDFKFPGTNIMRDLDVLIIDATYGDEFMVRPFKREIDLLFSDLVADLLSKGKPVIVKGYHGKLQEAMSILRSYGISAPFVMPEKVFRLTEVARKHGLKINDHFSEKSDEGREIIESGWFIYMSHANARNNVIPSTSEISLTGWFFASPIKKIYENGKNEKWIVALSDHADFEDTINYVEEAEPKTLIVDGYRTSREVAENFAKNVEKRLGIEAKVMPNQ